MKFDDMLEVLQGRPQFAVPSNRLLDLTDNARKGYERTALLAVVIALAVIATRLSLDTLRTLVYSRR